jgi:glycosyltransferase involved in cell wall biosynthesis
VNRLGIVIQRWHESIVGGAESLAWQWATLLKNKFSVDLLTTVALDAATWENALTPGETNQEGITIRRFHVDRQRTPYWHDLHRLLLTRFKNQSSDSASLLSAERSIGWSLALQEEFIYKQGPYSKGFIRFLSDHAQEYHSVIFFTYLFPTTYYGIRLVPRERCLLVPTLHDEAPAYLSAYRYMARRAGKLLWNTVAEKRLGTRLWGELPGEVVGVGIQVEESIPHRPGYPYLLYCGRIDPFKGIPQLLEFFRRFKKEYPSDLRLVLTGKDEMALPQDPDIEFLGFVSEEEKFRLMAGAALFVMPSPHESLSIVTLEAMAQRTPVLVNSQSEVLADHILQSEGGFSYHDYQSFSKGVLRSIAPDAGYLTMGEKARSYVVDHYGTDRIKKILTGIIESRGL